MAEPRAGSLLAGILCALYLGAAVIVFILMFGDRHLDDLAGWVPAIVLSQLLFAGLVGIEPRPGARSGVRSALAAALAALLVLAGGALGVAAPFELLERSGPEDLAIGLGIAALVVVAIAVLVTSVRFARLLAPASARGVAAVIGVVSLTGLWALASGFTCLEVLPVRPHGFLDGFVAIGALLTGGFLLIWALPLWLLVLLLASRKATEVTPSGAVS